VSVFAEPLVPGPVPVLVAEIPSARHPGRRHRVRLLPDGSLSCDCEAAYYQSRDDGLCRHVDDALEQREVGRVLAALLA
jgi:hypothetical protein